MSFGGGGSCDAAGLEPLNSMSCCWCTLARVFTGVHLLHMCMPAFGARSHCRLTRRVDSLCSVFCCSCQCARECFSHVIPIMFSAACHAGCSAAKRGCLLLVIGGWAVQVLVAYAFAQRFPTLSLTYGNTVFTLCFKAHSVCISVCFIPHLVAHAWHSCHWDTLIAGIIVALLIWGITCNGGWTATWAPHLL